MHTQFFLVFFPFLVLIFAQYNSNDNNIHNNGYIFGMNEFSYYLLLFFYSPPFFHFFAYCFLL